MTKQRNTRYEFLRTVAMVLVIGVHTLANTPVNGPWDEFWQKLFYTIFFLCNGLFFMLSGRFALTYVLETWEDYRRYYVKKLVGLGVPILVYMLIRTVYDAGWTFPVRTIARRFALNFLGDYASIDYWFLYQLVSMLLIAPVLGKFFQRPTAGRKEILLLLGMSFTYNTMKLYIGETGLPFQWRFALSGDLTYFLLGCGIELLVTDRRKERIVYALGAVSFVVAVLQDLLGFAPGIHGGAPTYYCMLTAAYLGLLRLYRPGKTADRVFLWIGKYSMAVYMLHVIVLNGLVESIHLDGYLLQVAVVMLLTTVISLAAAFLTENLVVHPIQKGLYRLLGQKTEKTT